MLDIDEVYRRALGDDARPFSFQRQIAEVGLPELLDVPTGSGKTPAMLLAWLYRRCLHADPEVQASTPTRLIWCLPLRTLTVQTVELARVWVAELGLEDQVDVHLLMGGEPVPEQRWRLDPQRPAIIVSTLDMSLSRALNRGYLASRFAWPIDFALFNDDCHWVFDEVQLMGTAFLTSRQLHGLRSKLGVPSHHSSTWMSATVGHISFATVDAPDIGDAVTLSAEDRDDEQLASRLEAPKRLLVRRIDDPKKYAAGFASIVRSEHVGGTTTVAVVNSVRHARDVAQALRRTGTDDQAQVVLLHSRFRPGDRAVALESALSPTGKDGIGRIVVSTQVIEAGVDLSATTLVTECAPWSSVVQRAGRCNRWGEVDDARFVVVEPSSVGPYDQETVADAWNEAIRHDGETVTPSSMATVDLAEPQPVQMVLRRKDLLELFDTSPDLSGNDIDVSRFIRADGDLDVTVAWRPFDSIPDTESWPPLAREEGCPVPVGEARQWLKDRFSRARTFDPLSGRWRPVRNEDVRPGARLIADTALGGYDPWLGFSEKVTSEVEPIDPPAEQAAPGPDDDQDITAEPLTTDVAAPVPLAEHLTDTERAAIELCDQLSAEESRTSIVRAARLHDLGKAHGAFQWALHRCAPEVGDSVVLAKSGGRRRLRYQDDSRRGFRHELVSALVLMTQPELAAEGGADPELVTYLVGAHHGRVRMGARSLPGEDADIVLGVRDGDQVPAIDLGDGLTSEATALSVHPLALGGDDALSWTARAMDLLERYGPFRLAWFEAVVRIADWRASIGGGRP